MKHKGKVLSEQEVLDNRSSKYEFINFETMEKEKFCRNGLCDGKGECDYNGCQCEGERLKYPIGGYAPGNYMCNCTTCKTQFIGDKRAVQCEPCAVKMVEKQHLKADEELGLYTEKPTPKERAKNYMRLKEGYIEKEESLIDDYYTGSDILDKCAPKQETLEEATENWLDKYSDKFEITKSKYLPFHFHNRNELNELINEIIKWQQERSYSQKEVLEIIRKSRYAEFRIDDLEEWFEQFKK